MTVLIQSKWLIKHLVREARETNWVITSTINRIKFHKYINPRKYQNWKNQLVNCCKLKQMVHKNIKNLIRTKIKYQAIMETFKIVSLICKWFKNHQLLSQMSLYQLMYQKSSIINMILINMELYIIWQL